MIHYRDFDFNSLPNLEAKRKKDVYYLNGDFGVDIEVTSFYEGENKRAYPYIMMVNVCGNYIYCRYLTELAEIFQLLKHRYKLSNKRRLIMFVHNLSYEFQFFRDICDFSEVFARTARKPMIYESKWTGLVRNGLFFYVRTIGWSILGIAMLLALVGLIFIPFELVWVKYIILVAYVIFLLPIILLGFVLFCTSKFDEYINKENYPEYYLRGLNHY